jgi:hypothetical protein
MRRLSLYIGALVVSLGLAACGTTINQSGGPNNACANNASCSQKAAAANASLSDAGGSLGESTTSSSASSQPSSTSPGEQYLASLTAVSSSGCFGTDGASVNGNFYATSVILCMNPGPESVEYNIERHWSILDATVGLRDDSAQNQEFDFQILADGRTIYDHVLGLGQSQHIRLNIAGALRIELSATLSSSYVGQAYAVWGNAQLLG